MTTGQQQIMIAASPTNLSGATLYTAPVMSQANTTEAQLKNEKELQFFAKASLGFTILGSLSIALGVGVLIAGILAVVLGSYMELGFTCVWAGFVFAIINGALAIKGGKIQPRITLNWSRVLVAFGITTLVLHLVDLLIAILSAAIDDGYYVDDCSSSSASCYSYIFVNAVMAAEAPRLIMLIQLVAIDICQVIAGVKCSNLLKTTAGSNVIAFNGQQITMVQAGSAVGTLPAASFIVIQNPQAQQNTAIPLGYAPQPAQSFAPNFPTSPLNQTSNETTKDGSFGLPPPYQ